MFSHSKRPLKDIDLALKSVIYPPQRRGHWGINIKGGKKMISERTLRKWREDALKFMETEPVEGTIDAARTYNIKREICNRILKLTQELLDQYLLRRKK